MEFDTAHSSIVMLGDSIVIGKFNVSDCSDVLGNLDATRSVLMPVYANYVFQDSAFQIQIHPGKIQIDYRASDIFPNSLLEVANRAATVFNKDGIRAIGTNLDVIIGPELLGESAVEFCLKYFMADIETWKNYLAPDDEFSSSGRINYQKNGIAYTIRFEPHFKSDKKNLFLDINAHQAIEAPVTAGEALKKYNDMKTYIDVFLDNVLAGAK